MPRIIPIRDLRDTARLSEMCKNAPEDPIIVTKNGYEDMVIISPELYEDFKEYQKERWLEDVLKKLDEAEEDIRAGRAADASGITDRLREKYGLQSRNN